MVSRGVLIYVQFDLENGRLALFFGSEVDRTLGHASLFGLGDLLVFL